MPEREHTCCFTGYREYKLPWGSDESDPRCRKLQQQIFDAVDAVYADGIRHFICGMANGCDLYFFDAARILIAAFDGRPGGTARTLEYAALRKLEIIQLPIDRAPVGI